MSIADDIAKVMRVHSFECLSDSEIAELAGDLAPRLAAWAQQVMPLVEAAEEYRGLHAIQNLERPQSLVDATYEAFCVARTRLLRAALALNLEVLT